MTAPVDLSDVHGELCLLRGDALALRLAIRGSTSLSADDKDALLAIAEEVSDRATDLFQKTKARGAS